MTQLQPTLFSHAPVQGDRILRSTPTSTNLQYDEGTATDFRSQLPADDSSGTETDCELTNLTHGSSSRSKDYSYGLSSSVHGQERASLRALRQSARRGYLSPSHVPRIGPTGLPDHLYEATYRHKDTKEIITRIQPIPEALSGAGIERYANYRARHRKDLGDDEKPVWPDLTEEAFQHAVRVVPPVLGKKKVLLPTANGGNRQLGRNELISIVIRRLTGESRGRKQISSHKQVLKNFSVLTDITQWRAENPGWEECHSQRTWKWDDEHCMLVCTDFCTENNAHATKSGYQLPKDTALGPLPPHLPGSTTAPLGCVVQRMDFNMSLYAKDDAGDRGRITHRFTTIQSECGAQAKPLEEVDGWGDYFPKIGALLKDGGMTDCDIVMLDSSLLLMDRLQSAKCDLGITFNVDIQTDAEFSEFHVKNTFYEDRGIKKDTHFKKIPHRTIIPHDSKRTRLFDIPLKAELWTHVFSKILNRRREKQRIQEQIIANLRAEQVNDNVPVLAEAEENASRILAQEDSHSARYLQEMSVVQEVHGYRRIAGNWEGKRVAIFLWKFRRAGPEEIATTTWRRLHQPSPRVGTNSPVPLASQPSLALDTNVVGPPVQILNPSGSTDNPFSAQAEWETHWSNVQAEAFAKSADQHPYRELLSEYYPDHAQVHYLTNPTILPSNGHIDASYNSHHPTLPSPSSAPSSEQLSDSIIAPSEALGMRMKIFYGSPNEQQNVVESGIARADSQAYDMSPNTQSAQSFNPDNCDRTPFDMNTQDGLGIQNATDSDMLVDLPTNHSVQFNLYNQQYTMGGQTNIDTQSRSNHSSLSLGSGAANSHAEPSPYVRSHSFSHSHTQLRSDQSQCRSQASTVQSDRSSVSPTLCTEGAIMQAHSNDADVYTGGGLLVQLSRSSQIEANHEQQWPAQPSNTEQEQYYTDWASILPDQSQGVHQVDERKGADGTLYFLRPIVESAGQNFTSFCHAFENPLKSFAQHACISNSNETEQNLIFASSSAPAVHTTAALSNGDEDDARSSLARRHFESVIAIDEHLRSGIAFTISRLDENEKAGISDAVVAIAKAYSPHHVTDAPSAFELMDSYTAGFVAANCTNSREVQEESQQGTHDEPNGVAQNDATQGNNSHGQRHAHDTTAIHMPTPWHIAPDSIATLHASLLADEHGGLRPNHQLQLHLPRSEGKVIGEVPTPSLEDGPCNGAIASVHFEDEDSEDTTVKLEPGLTVRQNGGFGIE